MCTILINCAVMKTFRSCTLYVLLFIPHSVQIGATVAARILFVDIPAKKIGLTLLSSALQLRPHRYSVKLGEVISGKERGDMIVKRIDFGVGMAVEFTGTKEMAYVHVRLVPSFSG